MRTKTILIAVAAMVVAAASCVFGVVVANFQNDDVFYQNVEALMSAETSGQVCYNSITTAEGLMVLYCGTCEYILGTKAFFSGKGICQ